MNYIREMNAFMDWLETNPLEPITQTLWFHLMAIANKCNWPEWFTVANLTLQAKVGIDKKTLAKHRLKLEQKNRIEYKTGTKKQAGKYRLLALEDQIGGIFPPKHTPNVDPIRDPIHPPIVDPLVKLNKTKLKNNKPPSSPPEKKQYAEFVLMTEKEYATLVEKIGEELANACIEKLNSYKGSSGKHYASDYMTMYSWVIDRSEERRVGKECRL